MIGGLVIGTLVGVLIGALVWGLTFKNTLAKGLVSGILSLVIMVVIGCAMDHYVSQMFIETYTATKTVVEQSLDNEKLSGFERVELVKQAAEQNSELASRKYTTKQWYGAFFDKAILELEPISLD